MRRLRLLTLAVIVVIIVGHFWSASASTVTISADFTRTVGLYPGSQVRLMGVPIGKVLTVTPQGATVHVTLQYDARYRLPADAQAVIISPSVVGDRFVQLTPSYPGRGPILASGTNLGVTRTRVPVELDQIYSAANDLLDALGPQGANDHGAVNRLLRVSAANLAGNGSALNDMLRQLAGATGALNAGSGDFYASLGSLNRLTASLAAGDGDVRAFDDEMARMLGFLAQERGALGQLMANLSGSFATISTFVESNRSVVSRNVSDLLAVTRSLVAERQSLNEIARLVPVGLDNLNRTWDPQTQAVRSRSNETEILKNARGTICDAVLTSGVPQAALVCQALNTVLGGLS